MADKMGLIDHEVRLVKKDEEQIDRITKARDIKPGQREDVKSMLRYDVWNTKQFSQLTGLGISTIANKCRPYYKNGELITDLDFCYPFTDLDGKGGKYIVRNEKSERLLP